MDKKIKDAFKQVTAEEELLKSTEDYVVRHMRKQSDKKAAKKWPKVRIIALTLAALLIVTFVGPFLYNQPVSAVSINSTGTTEIYFNRFNRMVDVVTYDENGDPISEEINLQNRQFDDVIDEVLSDSSSENVYITVASQNETKSERMVNDLSHHQERMKNMHIYHSNEEVMKQARESRTSMGRMHAMHQLNGEDFENKSTQELMEAMEKHHEKMMQEGHMPHQNGGHMHRNQ